MYAGVWVVHPHSTSIHSPRVPELEHHITTSTAVPGTNSSCMTDSRPTALVLGRTHLGSHEYAQDHHIDLRRDHEKGLLREASRTAGGTESSRPADRVLRMARGREVLEGSASRSDSQRTRRDSRGDLADPGFLPEPFSFVHGSAVRRT